MYIRIRIHQIVDDNSTGVRILFFLSAALSNSPKRQCSYDNCSIYFSLNWGYEDRLSPLERMNRSAHAKRTSQPISISLNSPSSPSVFIFAVMFCFVATNAVSQQSPRTHTRVH